MRTSVDADLYIDYYKQLIDYKQIPKYYKAYLEHVLKHKELVYTAFEKKETKVNIKVNQKMILLLMMVKRPQKKKK